MLVVDDEPNVCECIRLILTLAGHDVVTAHNGRGALEKFGTGRFDIVFTDYSMPGMKGDQLAAAVKAIAPEQPIVMISGLANAIATPANVDLILTKPFLPTELRHAIAQLMHTCETTP